MTIKHNLYEKMSRKYELFLTDATCADLEDWSRTRNLVSSDDLVVISSRQQRAFYYNSVQNTCIQLPVLCKDNKLTGKLVVCYDEKMNLQLTKLDDTYQLWQSPLIESVCN
jgi:hypothetical protein